MTTSIAEYYLGELYDWKSIIHFYIQEIDESEEWLETHLKFDTVPEFAAKVEFATQPAEKDFIKIKRQYSTKQLQMK